MRIVDGSYLASELLSSVSNFLDLRAIKNVRRDLRLCPRYREDDSVGIALLCGLLGLNW